MKFKELAIYLEKLEKTSSRIEITKILAELYERVTPSETDKITYLLLGQLAPSYKGIVFNLAERMMIRIIAKAFGRDVDLVDKDYEKSGDLGVTAERLSKSRGGNVEVTKVYYQLLKIAQEHGVQSQERKINQMAKVLSELDPLSARFVARIPVGRLRLGFSEKTIIDALSWMETESKRKSKKIEEAYYILPDVGVLAKRVKERGIDKAVEGVKPVVGVPILPMLAQRIKSPSEMIKKMGKVFVEPKFDGLRVLIHYDKDRVRDSDRAGGWVSGVKAFTRNLNNVVSMFSELKDVGKYVKADKVVLDTEAIGMDPEAKKMADFQTTMQRRRKHGIEEKAKIIPLNFQVFDIVIRNGENLMHEPYYKRREILKKTIKDNKLLRVDEAVLTDDPAVIESEYKEKVKAGLEGVMVKKYDTAYVPGRTGWRWVKMKQSESALGKLADTVDAIVMGYSVGKGKRTSFGLGQFLVGVRDNDKIKTVTKVGTGLTDEQFRQLKERLKEIEVDKMPKNYVVDKLLEPDFWVAPKMVVEVAADEITKSPNHSSGFALRFPRLVRFRDDKSVDQATTIAEVKKLFELQKTSSA